MLAADNMPGDKILPPGNITHSRVYDTAGWTFQKPVNYNLTWVAVLAIISFFVYVLIKVHNWFREGSKRKARGDVEFGDESDVNYGILSAGDKHFTPIDIRSDTTSVYDTVNSFRFIGNGAAVQPSGACAVQDTATSYKSLLMQPADGCQYDSVKSYKAFLQKVTQNKLVAVEVKLLENYPVKSKSTEHCYVVEEESSERSGDFAHKLLSFLPLKKQPHVEVKLKELERKRPKSGHPCGSGGDLPPLMRKRSASNPICRRAVRIGGANMPSIPNQTQSSDSEEDTKQSLMSERKRCWAERKRMYRSTSTGKITKDSSGLACSDVVEEPRRRHYSADSAKRPLIKGSCTHSKASNFVIGKQEILSAINKRGDGIDLKSCKELPKGDESSSENPTSSHSSCDIDVNSDGVNSDSNEEDTKLNTLCSTGSEKTLDNDLFWADSAVEHVSSSELLHHSPHRLSHASLTNIPPSIEEEADDKNVNVDEPLTIPTGGTADKCFTCNTQESSNDINFEPNNTHLEATASTPTSHSTANAEPHLPGQDSVPSCTPQFTGSIKPQTNGSTNKSHCLDKMEHLSERTIEQDLAVYSREPHINGQTTQKVQRFQVTFVTTDGTMGQSE